MLDQLFSSAISSVSGSSSLQAGSFFLCTLTSLVLGIVIAAAYTFRNTYRKGFVITLALLPAMVQMVIMLVNGNLGTGVAVMGAFSLVRFRSIPGDARDIGSIFLSMAVGLATGMGYLLAAGIFVVIMAAAYILLVLSGFGEGKKEQKSLHITIPESLDYGGIFEDLFDTYTVSHKLVQVKTADLGSLYKLHYEIVLKKPEEEKQLIDQLRCRNGNLEISCGRVSAEKMEL